MSVRALLLTVLVACGGSPKPTPPPPTPDPIPKTAGPSCKAVTDHLATLGDRDPTKTAAADSALRARCESDAWNDDARNCFATAQSDAELDGCKSMLTPGQREAFGPAPGDAKAPPSEPAAADAAAAPAPHRASRGPVPKGKGASKSSDPDEGGQ